MPEPVALQIQSPDAMTTIGNVMKIAGAAQDLQRGNIHLQREQQANTERLDLQKFMSNPDNFQTDGRIDLEKINSTIPKIAPLTGSEVLGRLSTLSKAQTEAADAKQRLTQDQRAIIAGPIGVLGRAGVSDPAIYVKELDALKEVNPNNPELHRLADSYKKMLTVIPPGGHIAKSAVTVSQSLMAPGAQQSDLSPKAGLTDTGGQLQETISQPAVGGNAPSISLTGRAVDKTGGIEEKSQDALGRPVIQVRNPQSGGLSFKPPQGSNYKPLMSLPVGETAETAKPLMALREQSQAAASQAPAEHFNNQQILNLTPDAFTGTGSGKLASIMNTAGLGQFIPKSAQDIGPATAQLRHFLALQVQHSAASMGANTDAAREIAERAVLPSDSPEKAVKAITRINEAYVTGKELFSNGLNAAINHPENDKDIFAARDFQNAWTKNFDPNVMRLMNAGKDGNRQELDSIAKELGSERMKALLPKYRALKSLSETGRVQ